MGVILVAGMFLGLICLILGACVHALLRYGGPKKYAGSIAILVAILFFLVELWPAVQFVDTAATRTEIGLSGREADNYVAQFGVRPNTATDVCWRLNPRRLHVDFKMAEPAFHDWMRSRRWQPQAFSTTEEGDSILPMSQEVYPVRGFESHRSAEVRSGYAYQDWPDDDVDNVTTVIYDRIEGRVYIVR